MKSNITERLRQFGFSEKEVKVYVALLELNSSIASGIAKKAGINRSTTYVILESLRGRGLVTTVEQRGATLYRPAPAEELARHLEAMAEQYSGFASLAKKLVPDLRSLRKGDDRNADAHPRPKVQLYEGAAGMRTVYEDVLSSLETIRSGTSRRGSRKAAPVSGNEWGNLPAISVHGNKIILVSPEEKFAAVVESKELAEQFKKILVAARGRIDNGALATEPTPIR